MPCANAIPVQRVYAVLGRLRGLQGAIDMFNSGVRSQSEVLLTYWKRRTLDQFAIFGFHETVQLRDVRIAGLPELIHKIEELFALEISSVRAAITNGLVSFDGLAELYRPLSPVQCKSSLGGTAAVFMVVESFFDERRSHVGVEKSFHWAMEFVVALGRHFSVVQFTEVMPAWTGVRHVSDLMYTPLGNQDDLVLLQGRGAEYAELAAGGARYLTYPPNSFHAHSKTPPARCGCTLLAGGGRVMIDVERGAALGHHPSQVADVATTAMIQHANRYRQYINNVQASSRPSSELVLWDTVPSDLVLYCWPALVGFSFTGKALGHVVVGGVWPIQFEEQSFDKLVLSDNRKQMIKSLVRFGTTPNATRDVVEGKSGGSVFLLHRPPGVGKSLTAEAIAEVLHRPLYYATMAELGKTAEDIEKRLGDILDLCAGWNAVVLVDDADVLLEERNSSDMARNSMVCVLLRLIEYHPGILFLTTNRIDKFDPALQSRATIIMRYEPLTVNARTEVWKNLLARVSVPVNTSNIAFDHLAAHSMNGGRARHGFRCGHQPIKERHARSV